MPRLTCSRLLIALVALLLIDRFSQFLPQLSPSPTAKPSPNPAQSATATRMESEVRQRNIRSAIMEKAPQVIRGMYGIQ